MYTNPSVSLFYFFLSSHLHRL